MRDLSPSPLNRENGAAISGKDCLFRSWNTAAQSMTLSALLCRQVSLALFVYPASDWRFLLSQNSSYDALTS